MATDSRVGGKVATVRESLGLTCDDLAQRSGCDVALITRIEAGGLVPSRAPLNKMERGVRGRGGPPWAHLDQRSGCEVALITRIEAGELVPSLAPLIKISRALGVRLGKLLDDATQGGPGVTDR